MAIVNNLDHYIAIVPAHSRGAGFARGHSASDQRDPRGYPRKHDIRLLTGKVAEIHTRLSLIEERIK
jgi:hypothetical protein